jgi:hypothetical protein
MTVVISYNRSDWEGVEPIVAFLKSHELQIWIDRESIRPLQTGAPDCYAHQRRDESR